MLEKMEMWQDAKESFTRMCENGQMKNRLRGQMMQLDSLESQKSMEKIRNRDRKTTFHKIAENDGFKSTFIRAVFSFGRTPLDKGAALEQFHVFQFLHSCLRHLAFLPAGCKIGNFFNFRFGLGFPWGHLGVTSKILRLRAIREAKGMENK